MKPKVAIWGASSNAMVVADIIRLEDKFEIVGFLDDFQAQNGNKEFWNLPILGGVEQLDCMYRDGIERIIVGIGDCKTRLEKAELALNKGYSLAVAIHPHASIAADVSIGPGTVIKSTAVVEPGVVIKQSVIVGARVYVGHECVLDDGVHISGGGVIGGNTVFGRAAWAGLGATIKSQVRIGHGAQIGAGSVVLGNIPDGVTVFGVPARPIWSRGLFNAPSDSKAEPDPL